MVFSFIIHTGKYHFVDRTLHENHENGYPTKLKPSTVINIYYLLINIHCISMNIAAFLVAFSFTQNRYLPYTNGGGHTIIMERRLGMMLMSYAKAKMAAF